MVISLLGMFPLRTDRSISFHSNLKEPYLTYHNEQAGLATGTIANDDKLAADFSHLVGHGQLVVLRFQGSSVVVI